MLRVMPSWNSKEDLHDILLLQLHHVWGGILHQYFQWVWSRTLIMGWPHYDMYESKLCFSYCCLAKCNIISDFYILSTLLYRPSKLSEMSQWHLVFERVVPLQTKDRGLLKMGPSICSYPARLHWNRVSATICRPHHFLSSSPERCCKSSRWGSLLCHDGWDSC